MMLYCENKLTKFIKLFNDAYPEHPALLDKYKSELSAILISYSTLSFSDSEELNSLFNSLHNLIYDDFLRHKNPDWINVLIEHGHSPLSAIELKRLAKPSAAQALTSKEQTIPISTITDMQRAARSYLRRKLHTSIFSVEPTTMKSLIQYPINDRFTSIVRGLSRNYNAVLKVHHWTDLTNLQNILRNRAFMGNDRLKRQGVHFKKNALDQLDISNGDANVICFCPYLVDRLVFGSDRFRTDIIRVTIDPSRLEALRGYNQFFKIYDFLAPPWEHHININDDLSVKINKYNGQEYAVEFILNGKQSSVRISKAEAMFYGNLEEINYFCLMQLFILIDKLSDDGFKKEFYTYLSSLNDLEIRKVLIVFAQGLTIFAEYNFNAVLYLKEKIVTEIYFQKNHTTLLLDGLSLDEYQAVLNNTVNAPSKLLDDVNVPRVEASCHEIIGAKKCLLYGIELRLDGYSGIIKNDTRTVSPEYFTGATYFETRPNIGAFQDKLVKAQAEYNMRNVGNSTPKCC